VIHVVRDLDTASGGPSRSVPALAEHQARIGVVVTVLYRDRGNAVVPLPDSAVDYRPLRSSLSSQFSDAGGTPADGKVLHLHGLWDPLLHGSARYARRHKLPYLVSPRGMLANWALGHKAWKKMLGWSFYQRKDLQAADCLMASSEFEQRDVAALLPKSRVEVIPNGCDIRPMLPSTGNLLPSGPDVRWALAMGRLHPMKGYTELIEAWADLRPEGWRLAIAGPNEDGYRARLEASIARLGLGGQVLLFGEVDDTRKWALLEQCELFVAPSKTENFGMAIAEALWSGRPVITTTGTPWRELAEHGCGWWVDPDPEPLQTALGDATRMSTAELAAMGERGSLLVAENYSWDVVAALSVALYESVLNKTKNKTNVT